MKDQIIASLKILTDALHIDAAKKGFWDDDQHRYEDTATRLALIHSEISEALEGLRLGNPPDDKIPEFSAMEAELADAVIRIFDLCGGREYRLAEAIWAKMEFNRLREYKHGKEF